MFCKYCGKEIDNDSVYCEGCGKKLKDTNIPAPPVPPAPHTPETKSKYTYDQRPAIDYSFGEAIRLYYTNAFNFEGRATRREYWWIVLYNIIVSLSLSFSNCFLGVFGAIGGLDADTVSVFSILVQIVSWGWSIVHFIPGLALSIRRLHDVGKNGWWSLIAFVPLINFVLIYWYCLSSEDDNEWGPSPYYDEDDTIETHPQKREKEDWFCDCGRKNTGNTCAYCGAPKETIPEGKWKCMGCGKHVSNMETKCSCGYHRVRASSPYHCAKCGFNGPYEESCPACGSSLKKYHH